VLQNFAQAVVDTVKPNLRASRRPLISSGNEVLAQSLSNGLSSVANAELGLRFLQVAANCLLAKLEVLGDFPELRPGRNEPQDCQFPRSQATV
jgi:hypothetical protein